MSVDHDTKVTFSGIDSLSPLYEKLSKASEDYLNRTVKSTLAASSSYKDFQRTLENQIKIQEREKQIQEALIETRAKEKLLHSLETIQAKRAVAEEYASDSGKYGKDLAVKSSRQLAGGVFEKEEGKAKELYNLEIQDLREQKEYRKTMLQAVKNMMSQSEQSAKEQYNKATKEDKQRIKEEQISSDPMSYKSSEEYMRAAKMKEMAEGEKTEKEQEESKKGMGVAAGAFIGTMAAQWFSKLKTIPGQMFGETSGEYMAADIAMAVPIIGDAAAGVLKKHIQEKEQVAKAANVMRGITGQSGWVSAYGYDYSEGTPVASQLALTRGYGGANLTRDAKELIGLSKAYGLDLNQVREAESYQRFTSGREGGTVDIKNMIELMKKEFGAGDYSRLQEFIQIQSSLISQKALDFSTVNPMSATSAINAVYSVRGMFANKPQEMLAKLDQALMNPQGEYNQALSYTALSQMNPNASWLEMQEKREAGIMEPGYMTQIMKNIEGMYGQGEEGAVALMNQLGIGAGQAKQLWGAYQMNPETFSNISGISDMWGTSKTEIDRYKSEVDVRAKGNVTKVEWEQAAISNAYATSAVDGLTASLKQMNTALDAVISGLTKMAGVGENTTIAKIIGAVINPAGVF